MTTMTKKRDGWTAKDEFILGDATERFGDEVGKRVLSIETSKGGRTGAVRLLTRATVMFERDGMQMHCFGLGDPKSGDFSERIIESELRCTEHNVKLQHESVMVGKDAIILRARSFYERQDAIKAEEARKREERAEARAADRIDGYDRDDIGASPDY